MELLHDNKHPLSSLKHALEVNNAWVVQILKDTERETERERVQKSVSVGRELFLKVKNLNITVSQRQTQHCGNKCTFTPNTPESKADHRLVYL